MSVRVIATLGSSTAAAPLLLSPAPVAAPAAPTGQPDRGRLALVLAVFALATMLLALGLGLAVYAYRHAGTDASATALGRSFAPKLCAALADGFDADADALAQKKTVIEADTALKKTFQDRREAAFAEHAAAKFGAIVQPNTEPKDEETRQRFIELHRDFAKGLRKVR